jgi:DNA-binding CsgD family transcriptional regulator/tetratricopeptide (TPR) repeat protein
LLVTSRTSTPLDGLDGVTRLDMPPLTPAEASELIEETHGNLDADERSALLDAAAGNPLLLLLLPQVGGVSPTLSAAVGERLSRAAPDTVEVLARLALHGCPAPRHWIASLTSADAEGMVAAVDGDQVWFTHDLIAREVLARLDRDQIDAQRRRLIELSGDSDAARHLHALGRSDEAANLAERAAAGADPSARADLLSLAVACRGEQASLQLRLDAADAMLAASRAAEARDLVASIGGDAPARAEAAYRRAQAHWLEGRGDEALADIEAAVDATDGSGSELEVRAVVERAQYLVRLRVGDPDIIPLADEAVALSRSRGVAVARALNVAGLARSHTGTDGWRERFDEARALAEADGDLDEALAANYWIVSSLGFFGPMIEAAALGDEMVERTERLGLRRWYRHFLGANVVHRFGLARLDDARLRMTAHLLEHEPTFRNRAQLDLILACAYCDLDRPDEAREVVERGRPYVRSSEDAALYAIARSELALQAGDTDAMRAAIDEIESAGTGFFGLNVLLESAAIHLAASEPIGHIPSFSAMLTPTLGMVTIERQAHDLWLAGDHDAAWRTMRAAADAWAERSMLRFAHRAYISAARLAFEAGEVDAADELVATARGLDGRMAPRVAPRRVDAVARSIERARARQLLTPREIQVLELVAVGRTTKEIADRLSIATATVETLVSDAMRRLRCATRRQAAAKVA